MADTREHRGPHPEDAKWFAASAVPLLRRAVRDYSWLLTQTYAPVAALKLVGDHYLLSARQRTAVMRSSCSDQSLGIRSRDEVLLHEAGSKSLLIDGYNVLTTVEAAIAGGVLLIGRDTCMRDMASMHGSWRKVQETEQAIGHIGRVLQRSGLAPVKWLLDEPVSNSGRLAAEIRRIGRENGWNWEVELVPNPDAILSLATEVVATADSIILDRCTSWLNLARYVVREEVQGGWMIDLTDAVSAQEEG